MYAEIGEAGIESFTVDERSEQLLALLDKENSVHSLNEKSEIIKPQTSITQSSLFNGAKHEPSMVTELEKEIVSAD